MSLIPMAAPHTLPLTSQISSTQQAHRYSQASHDHSEVAKEQELSENSSLLSEQPDLAGSP